MKKIRKAVAALMLMTAVFIAAGCSKPDEPNNGGDNNGGNGGGGGNGSGSGIYNGNYEFVDLGLPSGTLWATCNVGAKTPEGYGDYFAWGETEPKDVYDWSTYKYCYTDFKHLTKYCSNPDYGINGFTDTLTTLQADDDAATVNWGSEWCVPTKAQWEELYHNTTSIWISQNSVNGRLYTGSNGNTLFLPAAGGYRRSNGLDCEGSDGFYWSSSHINESPTFAARAWNFEFDLDESYPRENGARCDGLSVRPVRFAK